MTTAESVAGHASGSWVLVRFGLLLAMLAVLAWIGSSLLVGGVDGAAKQREYFGERPLPFGLEFAEAVRLPGGDLLVRFRRAAGREGAAREPVAITLIEYRSRAAVDPLFRSQEMGPMEGGMPGMGADGGAGMQLERWQRDPSFAWHTTMKRGEIGWGAWSSRMRIERSFLVGGGFEEQARVDLSSKERSLVLFADWSRDGVVDEEALRELLQAFVVVQPAG